MNRWIRRGLWAACSLGVLAGVVATTGLVLAERTMNRRVDVAPAAVALQDGLAVVERGRYLYTSRGCADCHGADGAGRRFIDSDGLRVAGPNISPGPGNVVQGYQPVDWVRTLRHGVKRDGRPLMIMPSEDYNRLTDADLVALVAYLRQMPAAAGGPAVVELPVPVRALYGFGMLKDAAAKIDHSLPPSTPVPEGVTVEHGRYVAAMCVGCHGPALGGGKIPGGPPDWPAAAKLQPGADSAMQRYPDADSMLAMFRSGKRPDGQPLEVMPFDALRAMSDVDARALHLYLKSLPAPGG